MDKIMTSMLVAVFVVATWTEVSVSVSVSANTHHVVGGDGAWTGSASGRVFRVGDKISFNCPATEKTIVELESLEDFTSCNLANPIRMYTDGDHHITLEEEGIRYFTSANPENCKNGLKLPVSVQPTQSNADHSFEPHSHESSSEFWPEPEPSVGPHVEPEPSVDPHVEPEPSVDPHVEPEPSIDPHDEPEPEHKSPPGYDPPVGPWPRPSPPEPSASSDLNGFFFVLFSAVVLCFMAL